ncbi:hypothetical protein EDD29_7225 [Actinocorallia herbida]|uniref:Uncharacterized protein n=1 Tax=Actinocorallia herbida TaxID=58109 RepID=A0A3N1D8W9_9ACTN|nr:hypothetical protein EDD29_7225 [Actinocorallia herbida]
MKPPRSGIPCPAIPPRAPSTEPSRRTRAHSPTRPPRLHGAARRPCPGPSEGPASRAWTALPTDPPCPSPARPGPARPGPARPGPARPGPARPGPARPGPARPARPGGAADICPQGPCPKDPLCPAAPARSRGTGRGRVTADPDRAVGSPASAPFPIGPSCARGAGPGLRCTRSGRGVFVCGGPLIGPSCAQRLRGWGAQRSGRGAFVCGGPVADGFSRPRVGGRGAGWGRGGVDPVEGWACSVWALFLMGLLCVGRAWCGRGGLVRCGRCS